MLLLTKKNKTHSIAERKLFPSDILSNFSFQLASET